MYTIVLRLGYWYLANIPNACPLQPLYLPCLDCAFLKTTTTPNIRDSKIISATPPSVPTKTVAITVDIVAGERTEFRIKYI